MSEARRLDLRVVLVTPDDRGPAELERLVEAALDGGVTAVLWRERRLTGAAAQEAAGPIARRVRRHGATLLVSRDAELAATLDADGVHTGWGGPALEELRRTAPGRALGRSAHWPPTADDEAADYISLSPFRATGRSRPRPLLDPSQVQSVLATPAIGPVVALGGLTADDVPELPAGLAGVAVIRALSEADDACRAAHRLRDAVDRRGLGSGLLQRTATGE